MLLVLPALLGALAVAAADAQQPPELVEQYTAAFSANLSAAGLLPFPHFWEECVGSSHMALGTRADWRAHLKKVRDACGFKRIRGHGLLDNDMDIILSNSPARCQGCTGRADLSHASDLPAADVVPGLDWHFNWYGMDQVYDYLLEIGMKPVVALSWSPDELVGGNKECSQVWHYKGCHNIPNNLTTYGLMINSLARHLVERHGVEEVRQWPFEVGSRVARSAPARWCNRRVLLRLLLLLPSAG